MKRFNQPDFDRFVSSEQGQLVTGGMKPRKPVRFWAVDVHNNTRCKSHSQEEARRYYKATVKMYGLENVEIRYVDLTEEDFVKEDQERRDRAWLEMVYKPTPARTIHHR